MLCITRSVLLPAQFPPGLVAVWAQPSGYIVRMAQGTNSLKLPECLPGTRAQNGSVASAGAGAGAGAGVLLRAGACPGAVVGLVARLVRLLVASALAVHTAARL